MASDTFIFTVKASLSRTILEKLPRECPSWRETNLQICALERSVEKFRKRFSFAEAAKVLGGGKLGTNRRKAMGVALSKLNQQSKKVKTSLTKTLEQGFYKEYPDSTATPRVIRRSLAAANKLFDKTVGEATNEFRAKVLAAVDERKNLNP